MPDCSSMTLAEFRQARSRAKRSAISRAALTVFRRDGFARASMEEIAGMAEVSTATLYRHFPSKAALFEAVAAESIHELTDLKALTGPPLERLRKLAAVYARILSDPDTRGLVRMLIAETGAGGELSARFYDAVKTRLSEAFAGAVAAGVEAGAIVPHEDFGHSAGQLQGMIEHATLMRGLVLGDEAAPLLPHEEIAASAFETWFARWGAARGDAG